MKTIFYNSTTKFELTDEEFNDFILKAKKGSKVWIPRLEVFLSDTFLWAGKKPDNINIGRLHDGTKVIKKFNRWIDANDENVKLDPNYYPEIKKDNVLTEEEYKIKCMKTKKEITITNQGINIKRLKSLTNI